MTRIPKESSSPVTPLLMVSRLLRTPKTLEPSPSARISRPPTPLPSATQPSSPKLSAPVRSMTPPSNARKSKPRLPVPLAETSSPSTLIVVPAPSETRRRPLLPAPSRLSPSVPRSSVTSEPPSAKMSIALTPAFERSVPAPRTLTTAVELSVTSSRRPVPIVCPASLQPVMSTLLRSRLSVELSLVVMSIALKSPAKAPSFMIWLSSTSKLTVEAPSMIPKIPFSPTGVPAVEMSELSVI